MKPRAHVAFLSSNARCAASSSVVGGVEAKRGGLGMGQVSLRRTRASYRSCPLRAGFIARETLTKLTTRMRLVWRGGMRMKECLLMLVPARCCALVS